MLVGAVDDVYLIRPLLRPCEAVAAARDGERLAPAGGDWTVVVGSEALLPSPTTTRVTPHATSRVLTAVSISMARTSERLLVAWAIEPPTARGTRCGQLNTVRGG